MNDAAESTTSEPAHVTRAAKIEIVATAVALLFKNGQTTERLVIAAERLGHALGVPLRLHPHWGELALQIEGTPFSEMVPANGRRTIVGRTATALQHVVGPGLSLTGNVTTRSWCACSEARPLGTHDMRDTLTYEQPGPVSDEATDPDASNPRSDAHEPADEPSVVELSALLLIVMGGIVLVFIGAIIAIFL
jgi:hypothetical protein